MWLHPRSPSQIVCVTTSAQLPSIVQRNAIFKANRYVIFKSTSYGWFFIWMVSLIWIIP